jgi:virginiamycin B lyase
MYLKSERTMSARVISVALLFAALAAIVPTFAQVTVQEYPLPSGVGVHDVWADAAPGGPVWFSAQRSGHLGILVIAASDGAPWLADGGQNAIVRVDPKTREVKVWPLPQRIGYADLNTAIFDHKGVHWFTGQSGYYGRLDPRSGEMKVFDSPRGRGTYGIHVTPDGTVFYASLAASFIGKINQDGTTTVIEPPTPRQGARRVWSDSKGAIWVSEWNSGNLSRYEPAGGKWTSWRAPGSAPHLYAVYVDETDKVWASEWSAQVMLRFDPATERFESLQSTTRAPNVRQIHGRKGEVWTPESGADKLVVYRYK